MKQTRIVVRWADGLHLRQAARLVTAAKHFRSAMYLRCGDKMADLRSILSILALCATLGTALDVETVGADEQAAIEAIEEVFLTGGTDPAGTKPGAETGQD